MLWCTSMGARTRCDRPYSGARDWLNASAAVRIPVSPQRVSDYRRIAALGDAWGLTLEQLGANYGLVRWVAGPGLSDRPQVEARYRAAIAMLRTEPWSEKAFGELRARFPRVKPRPGPRSLLQRALQLPAT